VIANSLRLAEVTQADEGPIIVFDHATAIEIADQLTELVRMSHLPVGELLPDEPPRRRR
jgi:hypothetical protein